MTKGEIRSFVKGLVRGISVEERARFSEALKEEVVGLECWRSAKEVMLFFRFPMRLICFRLLGLRWRSRSASICQG